MPDSEYPQNPEDDNWQYATDTNSEAPDDSAYTVEPVIWRSHEFIHHPKDARWYTGLTVGALLLAVGVYLMSDSDFVSVGVVIITAIVFGIFASRKPREMEYRIDHDGVSIGGRLYPFTNFKSFSQVDEDGYPAIWLMPLKRFMPILSLYFDPEQEETIIESLSLSLPFEDLQPGLIDNLMHRLKF
jgi:hypothetical protein